jgi:hypothetical protein
VMTVPGIPPGVLWLMIVIPPGVFSSSQPLEGQA